MVKGFKDSDGKFHPIGNYVKQSSARMSHDRMLRGSDTAQILGRAVADFARKRKENYEIQKKRQSEMFHQELELRRKFSPEIVRAYRQAKKMQITDPQKLKKYIYSKVPELRDDKDTLRFVQSIVNEYIEQERELKRKISGASEAEAKRLQSEFDDAINESKTDFEHYQKEQEKKVKDDITSKLKESEELLKKEKSAREKAEKELKEKIELEKKLKDAEQEKQDEEQLNKLRQELNKAKAEAESAMKVQENIERDIVEEIKDIKQESKEEAEVGFPEGII